MGLDGKNAASVLEDTEAPRPLPPCKEAFNPFSLSGTAPGHPKPPLSAVNAWMNVNLFNFFFCCCCWLSFFYYYVAGFLTKRHT
ncbi:hypothetical protein CEXT_143931 [Caerostris extrusa]|uniref:Uncharacterized protein n=1 Tax=Caerostris extrusa TaxID=172846 RepID=A0AAV4VFS0_CAEEX|nr:hypothetical protein CEXT_143931 [Caerostris extrusa]